MNEIPVDQTAQAPGRGQSRRQPSRLCQACMSVLAMDGLEFEKPYPHHYDLQGFIQASRLRCHICSWLFSGLTAHYQEMVELLAEGKIPDDAIARNGVFWDPRAKLREFLSSFRFEDERSQWNKGVSWISFTGMRIQLDHLNLRTISVLLNPLYEGYFTLPTTVYDSWLEGLWRTVRRDMSFPLDDPMMIPHQEYLKMGLMTGELPSNTGSMTTWTTVEGWVQQCSEQHRCITEIDPDWYPTRLVEIISNNLFRIVRSDSKDFQPKRGYVTLSHQWGNRDFIKLTKSNLATFQSSFPVRMLRKTFQDAIVVAQRMSVPHIWIDSLCIIQSGDDGADWREESAKMAQVYSNSFCNISADWGDESNGLFFERPCYFEPPCEVHVRCKIPESLLLLGMPSSPPDDELFHIVRPYIWSEDLSLSPLNLRGWVLQERQLASRILHFTPEGVSWECRMKTAWERTPSGFSDQDHARSCVLPECVTTLSKMRRIPLREPDVTVDWPRLVADYTTCRLTRQSDRLVAVAGIAKVLASAVKDQYVAGIWSKSLPGALVWRVLPLGITEESCSSTTTYFAPSFSWAAAGGMVSLLSSCSGTLGSTSATFVQHREKPLSSIPDKAFRANFSGQLLTDDVFGPMVFPQVEVRMQGILRSCRLVPHHRFPTSWCSGAIPHACSSVEREDCAISSCFDKDTVFQVFFDHYAEGNAELASAMYYYTIISCSPFHFPFPELNDAGGYQAVQGVLLRSVDSSMGRFERVGYVEHSQRDNEAFGSILLPLGNERELPAWNYDENTGQHTFFIV